MLLYKCVKNILFFYTHEAEWNPFQTYYSQNLVAPGVEHGTLDLYPGTMTTRSQRRSMYDI
jgi:hypothetical protein